ncbi:hypothetical protein [Sphingomonas solaris]|uniref:Uncharacterized protein n=1 Tax=Alterirhizorhabdus solaris TaxID=2529389 RepID=A0A558R7D7_9SPHN|nr:hypothetical protein [Sphingomonas solaris]TVV75286.1 hypothetical protein FOY91_07510 [Sphingomonas solaris]
MAALLLSGMVPLLPPVPMPAPAERVQYADVTIRERVERVIVRIRTGLAGSSPTPKYKEKKAPRCIAAASIAAAAVTEPDSVDFVLKGGERVRARLDDDCPALDYYGGFYLRPTADRTICADRDSIHARSGGECAITRFRKLVPPAK